MLWLVSNVVLSLSLLFLVNNLDFEEGMMDRMMDSLCLSSGGGRERFATQEGFDSRDRRGGKDCFVCDFTFK